MAPRTRSTRYKTPPSEGSEGIEATTRKRCHFFDYYDDNHHQMTVRHIAEVCGTNSPTARRWLRQRDLLGSAAYRRTRKLSKRLGRRPSVSISKAKMLVSPTRNPVQKQAYEAQIQFHNLGVVPRTLQRRLKECTNGGQRYKMAYTKKEISPVNKEKRVRYSKEHEHKLIHNFWKWIIWTDEAHIDPTSLRPAYILREEGSRTAPENIDQRPEKKGVKLHIAGWVNYFGKSEKLEFYHDEEEETIKPKRPPKPRTRMYESKEEYDQRIIEWEKEIATLPHDKEVKPKGNSMTQKYYTERLLPIYINTVNSLRLWDEQAPWKLQEDGDPSHGFRGQTPGIAQRLKDANWIINHEYPPQSPDLNPTEACWNIIKNKIRYRVWENLDELKVVIQEE